MEGRRPRPSAVAGRRDRPVDNTPANTSQARCCAATTTRPPTARSWAPKSTAGSVKPTGRRPRSRDNGRAPSPRFSVEVGGRFTLTGASFSLHAGDKVGLVGRNGAGKTSMLKVLAGEAPAAAGVVAAARCGRLSPAGPAAARRRARRHRALARAVGAGPRRRRAAGSKSCAAQGRRRPVAAQRQGVRQRARTRSATRAGTPPSRRCGASPPVSGSAPTVSICRSARSPAASAGGSSWRASCSRAATCCCSTSRPTTSTSTPRRG